MENSDGKLYWHQYMQNILAAQSEGTTLRNTLANIGAIENPYTFIIPVYENMPEAVSERPSTDKVTNQTDVELVKANVTSSIKIRSEAKRNAKSVGNLVAGEIATRLEKATEKIDGTYWDKILKKDGTVGYVARCTYDDESTYKEYLISVAGTDLSQNDEDNSSNGGDGSNNGSDNNNGNSDKVNGDANGDGKITAGDYVLIKNSIMGLCTFTDEQKNRADYNEDGKITASDYVLVKNKIMEN